MATDPNHAAAAGPAAGPADPACSTPAHASALDLVMAKIQFLEDELSALKAQMSSVHAASKPRVAPLPALTRKRSQDNSAAPADQDEGGAPRKVAKLAHTQGAQGAPSNPTPQDADNGRRHIIPGLILAHTPPSQWVALRGVSKSFRDIIDSRLYEHLIIEPAEGYWSDVLPPTIRGIHGLLPAPPTIEYIGWNAQQETRLWPGQALPATLRTDATQRLRRAKLVDLHRVPPSAAAGRTEAWLCQVLGAIKTLRLFPSANGHYMSSKMVATKVIVYPTAIEPRCGNSWELPPGVQKSVQHLRPQAQDAGILNVCEAQPGVAEEVWLFTDGDPLVESPVELDTWRAKILEWAGNEEAIDPAAADGDQEGTHRPVGGCDMAWRQIIEVATDRVFPHSNNTSQSRLTIVGLETANPVWLGFPRLSKGKDLEERLMRDLAVSLEDNDEMDPALLVGAMNQVRFITYEEYDKEVGPEARELEAFPLYWSPKVPPAHVSGNAYSPHSPISPHFSPI